MKHDGKTFKLIVILRVSNLAGTTGATIKDVACEANVSIATVSIVLNGNRKNKISAETERSVLEAVNKLGYLPNKNARVLRGKATKDIGIIVPDISNPFYSEMAKGAMDKASAAGFDTIMFNTDNDVIKEKHALLSLVSMRASGAIICGTMEEEAGDRTLDTLSDNVIPYVLADRYYADSNFNYVGIDNFRACYDMMKALAERGHKRVALIMQELSPFILSERYRGCKKAAEDFGMELDDDLIMRVNLRTMASADKSKIADFIIGCKCSAVFSIAGDVIALQSISELERRNVKVPDDMELVGIDDINASGLLGLSTVSQPKYQMGWKSAEMLIDIIETEKKQIIPEVLDYNIIFRKTTK